ncbi:MAG: prepilin-type N-terminal cleavage/methylation domain-containing protein [Cyanobacteria bacterium]|nr:prepilin-type N-terminal cleavage/methylation domain-containing protein [Cyanobacteriota bacterium]MDA0865746.1 prepilin-type N-terminal cleavage/methylation domain-containing protein [Cyanobacteriota bacterium]
MVLFNRLHRLRLQQAKPVRPKGFTLLEAMVVVVLVGIVAGIAAPDWIGFFQNRQVTLAREELHQGVQMAQTLASTHRQSWRFSLRERAGQWEWAVHPNEQLASDVDAWSPINENVEIYGPDTTLAKSGGIYYVRFGHQGEVIHRLSTVTVIHKSGTVQDSRCVVISTLLGATRKGQGQDYPNTNGRYCY